MIKRLVSIMLIYCLFCGFNVQSMHSGVLARKNAGGAVEDGLVGFNGSPTTTLNDTSAHQGYLYGGGYTPSTIGVINYMHIEVDGSGSGSDSLMGLYDSGGNLVAESASSFALNDGVLNSALSSEYTLTNQTYYLVVVSEDNWAVYSSAAATEDGKRMPSFVSDYVSGMPSVLATQYSDDASEQIRMWADNTATGV